MQHSVFYQHVHFLHDREHPSSKEISRNGAPQASSVNAVEERQAGCSSSSRGPGPGNRACWVVWFRRFCGHIQSNWMYASSSQWKGITESGFGACVLKPEGQSMACLSNPTWDCPTMSLQNLTFCLIMLVWTIFGLPGTFRDEYTVSILISSKVSKGYCLLLLLLIEANLLKLSQFTCWHTWRTLTVLSNNPV